MTASPGLPVEARENAEIRWVVAYGDIERIDLSGGTTRTGGGYVGGGSSLTGAAKGMMAAAALNALTESSDTRTVLRVATASSEVFFLYREADPGPLRIVLSHAFFAIESGRSEPQPST